MEKYKGKFIVIDGTDGSGKTTQLNLLADKLRQDGFAVEIADFPQYNTKSAGAIEEYLSGKYGQAEEVGPYKASIFYAVDRYDASFQIKEWLKEGKIVLSNRYVSSNMGHQGSKFSNPLERKAFFNWLYDLEYRMFEIPKPDLSIILHVESEIAQELAKKRQREDWTGKTKDIHEDNLEHLKKAEKIYQEIASSFANFKLIKCTNKGKILPPEEISYLVWIYVKRVISLGGTSAAKNWQAVSDIISKNHGLIQETINKQSDKVSTENEKDTTDWLAEKADDKEPILISVKEEKDNNQVSPPKQFNSLSNSNNTNQDKTIIKIKKIDDNGKKPDKDRLEDASFNLYAAEYCSIPPYQQASIKTGWQIYLPTNYQGLIYDQEELARSGFKIMGGYLAPNSEQEIEVVFKNLSEDIYHIAPGQKIARLLIQLAPQIGLSEI